MIHLGHYLVAHAGAGDINVVNRVSNTQLCDALTQLIGPRASATRINNRVLIAFRQVPIGKRKVRVLRSEY